MSPRWRLKKEHPTSRRDAGRGPIRTCIGCRQRRPQHELVRFIQAPDGSVIESRTLPGRGAWLCDDTLDVCRAKAEQRGAFMRAFRTTGRHTGRF